jgi:hypothetical protein
MQMRRCAMTLRGPFVFAAMFVLLGAVGIGESKKNVIYSSRQDVATTQTVECLGTIDISFTDRQIITEWSDGSGGYHYADHGNVSHFRGITADGTEYSGSQAWNYTFHVAAGASYPLQEVYTANLHGESHGAGPNVTMKARYHLTINGPGQAAVSRDLFSIECIPD